MSSALPGTALAQIAPGPGPQVPSQQVRVLPTRQQVEEPSRADTAGHRPVVNVQRLPEPGACPLTNESIPVALTRVDFTSARGGELAPELVHLLSPLQVAPSGATSIKVVCDIRDRANAALFRAGYVASVQIPAQEISDGVLRLSVVAARIVETRVTGYDGKLPAGIAARVAAIRAMDPLNRHEAERLLLLANDVPGLTLTLTLQPAGRDPGEVIATIDVRQQSALVLANFQNSGSRQLGRELFSVRGEFYNLTGHADETFIGFSNSAVWKEVHVVQGGHSVGLGTGGVRLGVRASYAESRPDLTTIDAAGISVLGPDLRSRSLIAGLDLSTPLLRTLARTGQRAFDINIYAGAGFELINQRTIIRQNASDIPYTRDRLRVLYGRVGGRFIGRDAFGVTRTDTEVLVELRKGLSILNATPLGVDGSGFQPSRVEGDPEAFEIRGTINETIRPLAKFDNLAFDLAIYGQWANHPLLNLEEFSVGNLTYGRGYDPGANSGDRAVALRFAPRLRLTGHGSNVQAEATGFFDAVRLWNLDTQSSDRNRLLRSVGGGLRVSLANRIAAEAIYAHPIDFALSLDTKRPPDRLLFSLTAQLAPWRF